MTEGGGLRNRIVGYGVKAASEFEANPDNWRLHSKAQQAKMRGLLRDLGWVGVVVVNAKTGRVIDGHMRVETALQEGPDTPVPYIEVDLNEDEERLALATFDVVQGYTGRDEEKYRELVEQLSAQDTAVIAMLREIEAQVREVARPVIQDAQAELEISPELYERHDYIVVLVSSQFDWQVLCERLGLSTVQSADVYGRTLKHKGIARVITAERLLEVLGK